VHFHCSWAVGIFCYTTYEMMSHLSKQVNGGKFELPTFWILYLLKYGMASMMIQGRDLPKYTNSCIRKDMMPVARTSFCMYAYPARVVSDANSNKSGTPRCEDSGRTCRPESLEQIELNVILRYFVKLSPVGVWSDRQKS
jgi:hypothetical protein